jgi:hypothetical protein
MILHTNVGVKDTACKTTEAVYEDRITQAGTPSAGQKIQTNIQFQIAHACDLYILSSGTYCVCRTIGQKIPLFC